MGSKPARLVLKYPSRWARAEIMHLRLEAVEEGYHADDSEDGRDGCDCGVGLDC